MRADNEENKSLTTFGHIVTLNVVSLTWWAPIGYRDYTCDSENITAQPSATKLCTKTIWTVEIGWLEPHSHKMRNNQAVILSAVIIFSHLILLFNFRTTSVSQQQQLQRPAERDLQQEVRQRRLLRKQRASNWKEASPLPQQERRDKLRPRLNSSWKKRRRLAAAEDHGNIARTSCLTWK